MNRGSAASSRCGAQLDPAVLGRGWGWRFWWSGIQGAEGGVPFRLESIDTVRPKRGAAFLAWVRSGRTHRLGRVEFGPALWLGPDGLGLEVRAAFWRSSLALVWESSVARARPGQARLSHAPNIGERAQGLSAPTSRAVGGAWARSVGAIERIGRAVSADHRGRVVGTRCIRFPPCRVRVRARGLGVQRCHLQASVSFLASTVGAERRSGARCIATQLQSSPLLFAATDQTGTIEPVRKRSRFAGPRWT